MRGVSYSSDTGEADRGFIEREGVKVGKSVAVNKFFSVSKKKDYFIMGWNMFLAKGEIG